MMNVQRQPLWAPRRAKPRQLNELPQFRKSSTLSDEPTRPNERKLSADPTFVGFFITGSERMLEFRA